MPQRPGSSSLVACLRRALAGPLVLVTIALLSATPLSAATIRVPADQPTIQAGVDAAGPGDLVLVAAGLYNESVSVVGRTDLRIEGEDGPTATSVLSPGLTPAFLVADSDNVVVSGFRISSESFTGDSGTVGGVILQRATNAAVHHCIFTQQGGNAILVLGATFEIWNVLTYDIGDDAVSLRAQSDLASSGIVHSCTFVDSTTSSAIGVWTSDSVDRVSVFNCIIHGNNYGLADGTGRNVIDHDFNLIGASTVDDYYGAMTASPNEVDCDPMFVDRPGADYHLMSGSCAEDVGTDIFLGATAATDDIDLQPRPRGAGFEMGVDEIGCAVSGLGPSVYLSCSGEDLLLDASGVTLSDCVGAVTGAWQDDPAAPAQRTVAPTVTSDYVYELTCSTDSACSGLASFTVTVEGPPKPASVTATDLAPCNAAILLEWEGATFENPVGAVYNVYRSEVDCADALGNLVARGLSDQRWLDDTTVHGGSYWYVVEAEDGRPGGACLPQGADHLGSAARSCIGPVEEIADAPPPAVVYAVLRASHQGQGVRLHWETSRPLLANEHFHLLKAVDSPEAEFSIASSEPSLALEHVETDTSSRLQFFDLRAANECEQQSEDEYPAGWDH